MYAGVPSSEPVTVIPLSALGVLGVLGVLAVMGPGELDAPDVPRA
jgi:hypothetical protein